MSDLWESLVNLYRLRLIPTVKRMLDRRRFSYTLLTVGVLTVCAAALSLLVSYAAQSVTALDALAEEYELFLVKFLSAGNKRSPMPEMGEVISLAKGGAMALAIFCGGIWLVLSAVAVGWVMTAVMESEAYVYGLFMIYGADRKQLSRQLSLEFILAGLPALGVGVPLGYLVYRLAGGSKGATAGLTLLSAVAFLLLILVSAAILSGRVLKRPCMGLLNASDTSDLTVSPRRSRLGGLNGKRGSLGSALLAFVRMRRHFISLALVTAIVAASAFGSLSLGGGAGQTADSPSHTFYFQSGISAEELRNNYLEPLDGLAAVREFSYAVTDTAEGLGTHLKLTEAQNPAQSGVYLGAQYATDSIRIACGDGNAYYELGGSNPVPPEFSHIPIEAMSRLGYDLEAVPAGCAVYVFPEQTGRTLDLKVGDHITLSLPTGQNGSLSQKVETEGETVTLRIVDTVAVGNVIIPGDGTELFPRITEDYLYISPPDYEAFSGDDRAVPFTAEEVYPDELFGEDTEDTCILAVPDGYFKGGEAPDVVTVIHPAETARELFSSGMKKLDHLEYFINQTYRGTGIYLGTEKEYLTDPNAAPLLEEQAKKALTRYLDGRDLTLIRKEYRVTAVIPMPKGSKPYVILPRTDEVNYNRLLNDLCALRLGDLSDDAPALKSVVHEAYVLSTSVSFRGFGYGGHLYLGTSLPGDFPAAMEAAGVPLQLPAPTFAHSRVTARGSFSMGDTHYLLAEPFSDFNPKLYPQIDADQYPRYVTGVGCFYTVGDTVKSSVLSAKEQDFYALLHEDNIGRLKAESIPMAGYYAVSDWVISPSDESALSEKPSRGTCVLAVPSTEKSPFRVGDTISVAVRQDTSAFANDPELMGLTGDRLLAYLQERLVYEYVTLEVAAVVQGDRNALVVAEEDLSAILGQDGIYRKLEVYPYPTVTMEDYMNLHTAAKALSKAPAGEVTLLYDPSFITATAERMEPSMLTRAMGGAALLLLPLLLMSSQFLFYGKREEEYAILYAIGKTPRERKAVLAAESGLFCVTVTLAAALACPVGYGLVLMLADALGLPLPPGDFNPLLYGGIIGIAALSSAVVGILACTRLKQVIQDRRSRS